jgi:radical SAM superfamily enzyme YgiQ (UPF0313 family)
MKQFRVLLVYANSMMDNLLALGVSILSTVLKENGFDVKLFDTTFYKTQDKTGDDIRAENLQVRQTNPEEYGIFLKQNDVKDDFIKCVLDYKPDLIALSCIETTYLLGISLLNAARDFAIPTIVGGVHATFSPEEVISEECVDMICIGEGERALVELCEKMNGNENFSNINNIWVKENGKIIKNSIGALTDINAIPYPDFSIFERERFFKPMRGEIQVTLPIEFSRGCPYNCAFCCNTAYFKKFRKQGRWYREKRIEEVIEEIKYHIGKCDPKYLFFVSETFLSQNFEKFKEFVRLYKPISLPFFINTRPETISGEKVRMLEDINCEAISMGIESGNEEFRKKVLRRNVSNEQIIRAFRILEDSNIRVSANNIIGFPDETRENIFETIELNRRISSDSFNVFIFQPFRGTELRNLCIQKGYLSHNALCSDIRRESVLKMQKISSKELLGLLRTFSLYVRFDKSKWPLIKKAESFDYGGNQIFKELSDIYFKKYLQPREK